MCRVKASFHFVLDKALAGIVGFGWTEHLHDRVRGVGIWKAEKLGRILDFELTITTHALSMF